MNRNNHHLTEGLDETQQRELGNLHKLESLLESDHIPDPEMEQLNSLVSRLTPYMPSSAVSRSFRLKKFMQLARSQLSLFESSFWLAGLSVLAIGLLTSVLDGPELLSLTFVLLSPILAAASVAYAFRPETRTLGELERLTATSPLELLYARLVLVFGFNLLIVLLLLLMIWAEGPQVALWRLVLAWLGPMSALTGTALYATLRWGALVGSILPLGLWASLVMVGWRAALLQASNGITISAWLLSEIAGSPKMLIGAVSGCILGLGLLLLARKFFVGEKQSWS
jgi:hypothetical protein